jgi:hypothetical protein
MARIRLYHGTAHTFPAFDDRFALRGTEPNSALGIHLTECPALAADYAELARKDSGGSQAIVLVIDAEIGRVAVCSSAMDYLGRDPDDPFETTRPASDFVAARLRLQDRGYDAVAVDCGLDDLASCWAVFDPGRLSIVSAIGLDAARALDQGAVPEFLYEPVRLHEDEPAEAGIQEI